VLPCKALQCHEHDRSVLAEDSANNTLPSAQECATLQGQAGGKAGGNEVDTLFLPGEERKVMNLKCGPLPISHAHALLPSCLH
jgi:hypothetical protein